MKILAFNGSPRRKGNTTLLLQEMLRGAKEAGAETEEIIAHQIQLKYCRGCLRCNLLKRCTIADDEWPVISKKILNADTLIFASPVYFHHLSAPLKKVLDRFRSFFHVKITEEGLHHTPWHKWRKKFILLLCLGSSNDADAQPIIELFRFISRSLGPHNTFYSLVGTRLAVPNQVTMTHEQLTNLYQKLHLPISLVEADYQRNQKLLKQCHQLFSLRSEQASVLINST